MRPPRCCPDVLWRARSRAPGGSGRRVPASRPSIEAPHSALDSMFRIYVRPQSFLVVEVVRRSRSAGESRSSSGILYPWYKVVQDGMYWYEPVRTLVDTRPYKKPQIGTRQYVLTSVIPRSVRTGMYWYVLTCTIWYKVVQGGTRWYKAV